MANNGNPAGKGTGESVTLTELGKEVPLVRV
jgi:hypothetical protein